MKRGNLFFVLMFILIISLGSAVSLGDIESSEIKEDYEVGDVLKGVVNISLDEEFISNDFYAKFSGVSSNKINLFDFIDNQTDVSYTCFPDDCTNAYKTKGDALTSKDFSLQNNKLFGVKISGSSVEISDFKFDVVSDAQSNCDRQLSIDLFDDGVVDWVNNDFVSQTCGDELKSDCNTGSFPVKVQLKDNLYCEKINLTEAPGIRVGVNIAIDGSPTYQDDLLKASIYDSEGTELGSTCYLSNPASGRASCNLDYAVKEDDTYYLCVSLKSGSVEDGYKLKARTSSEGGYCGHASAPGDSELGADYDITAHALKYSNVGSFSFGKDVFEAQGGGDLILSLGDYLGEVYGMDCDSGCVIPIKFSGISQDIDLNGFSYSYSVVGNAIGPENSFYEIVKSPATVDMDYSLLLLDNARIKVPQTAGDYTLELFSGTTKLLEKDIVINEKQTSLISQVYPSSVAVLDERTFVAFTDLRTDLSNATFKWYFEDETITTDSNLVKKAFPTLGTYDCKVEVYKNSELLTSYDFKVESVSPKNAINETLKKYKEYLTNIEDELKTYSDEYFDIIDIDTDDLRSQLESIESDYDALLDDDESTDQQYVVVMSSLVTLNIPIAIQKTFRVSTRVISDADDISIEDIEDLFNEFSSGDEDDYKNAIATWSFDEEINLNKNILSIFYVDGEVEKVLTEYNFEINSELDSLYVVIEAERDSLIFDSDYDVYSSGNDLTGVLLDLEDLSDFSFAIEGEYSLFDLDVYFSPVFDDISISGETVTGTGKKSSKIWMVVVVVIFLILFFLVAYIFLLRYYKFRYESSLFKNPGDLQNLMNFIRNAKAKGKSDKEIREKLLKAKWRSEQITYAMKKIKGQPIIWEPPFLKRFTEKKQVVENNNLKKGGSYNNFRNI